MMKEPHMNKSTKEWAREIQDILILWFGGPADENSEYRLDQATGAISNLLAKQKEEWVEMCEEMKQAEENPNDDPYYSISDAMVYNQALSDLLAKLRE